MSKKLSIRVDKEIECILDKYSNIHEGNTSKTICHIIKSYDSNVSDELNMIPAQSIAYMVDLLNDIEMDHPDTKAICKEIRRELIRNVDGHSK